MSNTSKHPSPQPTQAPDRREQANVNPPPSGVRPMAPIIPPPQPKK